MYNNRIAEHIANAPLPAWADMENILQLLRERKAVISERQHEDGIVDAKYAEIVHSGGVRVASRIALKTLREWEEEGHVFRWEGVKNAFWFARTEVK
jgi:hypothetical protein